MSSSTSSGSLKSALQFDNVNLRELPLDPEAENFTRSVAALFSLVTPTPVDNPHLVIASDSALKLLGLDADTVLRNDHKAEAAQLFAGNELFEGSQPSSHCYCGHQFGSWAGQLGDGRAISVSL